MNFCFEKFVDCKRIISDGLNSVLFLILSELLRRMYFFVSSNYMNTGVTLNFLMRQKNYGKDNEANPGRSNYVG